MTAFVAMALLLGASVPVLAQAPQLQVQEADGSQLPDVRTSLNDFLWSSEGGLLKSIYVHFVPLQSFIFPSPWPAQELIPGTTVETTEDGELTRSFDASTRFPFELTLDGESTAGLAHRLETDRSGEATLITFTAERDGLRITKAFRLTNNPQYRFHTTLELTNTTDRPIELQDGLRLMLGAGVGDDPDLDEQTHFLIDGEIQNEAGSEAIEGLGFEGQALTFFLTGFDPSDGWQAVEDSGTLQAQLPALTLASGESRSFEWKAIAGRTKHMLLREEGLEDLAPPGFFGQFVVYVSDMLSWFFSWTGNYGWAIILFTLVTRIVLFPLMRKQFHSMSAMAELRPQMEKLQQRYPTRKKLQELHPNMNQQELMKRDRENRQQLQQKMMELYREEGVNPLSGCLPMLVQFPILILLYRAIIENAEAIHLSPGFLWMPDLATQDPTWIIMILTVGTLFLQSKTNPMQSSSPQSASQQNTMMIFMGGFMLVALHNFPAGLWLYYFLTNVVQVSQQLFVKWEINQHKARKAAMATADASAESEAAASETAIDPERLDQTPEMPDPPHPEDPDGDDAESERRS